MVQLLHLLETCFRFEDTNRLKINTQKGLCHTNISHKKDGVPILIAGKMDFKT